MAVARVPCPVRRPDRGSYQIARHERLRQTEVVLVVRWGDDRFPHDLLETSLTAHGHSQTLKPLLRISAFRPLRSHAQLVSLGPQRTEGDE